MFEKSDFDFRFFFPQFSESKSKRVSLKKKYKIIKKVKEHHKKKAKEAKKLGLDRKPKKEKDPGIPNDWPFKEQELRALEDRRARALEEIEQKKAARKERVWNSFFISPFVCFGWDDSFIGILLISKELGPHLNPN